MDQKTIAWQAPEFKYYPKTFAWYAGLIILALLAVVFFIIFEKDIFAAVSLLIIFILIIIFSRHKPAVIDIELDHKGVNFGNLFYPYVQLKSFWIVENPRHKTVNFITSAYINNMLIVELENQNADEVKNFLVEYLPVHSETQETPAQRFMHRFKF